VCRSEPCAAPFTAIERDVCDDRQQRYVIGQFATISLSTTTTTTTTTTLNVLRFIDFRLTTVNPDGSVSIAVPAPFGTIVRATITTLNNNNNTVAIGVVKGEGVLVRRGETVHIAFAVPLRVERVVLLQFENGMFSLPPSRI
jgi:hypothetical protein